jgi:outer membrane protein assembly factor BamD (BamD/ComL family)
MKEFGFIVIAFSLFSMTVVEFGFWDNVKKTAHTVHKYEYKSLALSKELRLLKLKNQNLQASLASYKAQKEHMAFQLKNLKDKESTGVRRIIASVPKKLKNDLVDFDVYKWSPEKLLGVGEKALHFKDWEKSAQFLNALVEKYPNHKSITAQVYFQAGIAAYESKKHYEWATTHFSTVLDKYPLSKYVRGSKLWLALSHHHSGDDDAFMKAVDEFRLKYRNTKEWKILSQYYEDIAGKYGI